MQHPSIPVYCGSEYLFFKAIQKWWRGNGLGVNLGFLLPQPLQRCTPPERSLQRAVPGLLSSFLVCSGHKDSLFRCLRSIMHSKNSFHLQHLGTNPV